ncbi:NlpC/P60 family protein [Nesterenkonia massiliensis]|uniref:NlpC/P60 family protein n=1 Tax=Nesterenkonia massiliensis TaxID=1232429 RepID=A0ABT2HTM8_9MICC|nr:NlpC/P60 family protein [Nesterenkonia massiliensis]MCT1608050.1 NlpC/P60 family protein [Nesterenkonia massiliensis]
MTSNTTSRSRRQQRRTARLSRATLTGRTTVVALAATGLVASGGVAANAETPAEAGRAATTIDLGAALQAEPASANSAVTVAAGADIPLSFDRPMVKSTPAPEPAPQPEPVEETVATEAPAEPQGTVQPAQEPQATPQSQPAQATPQSQPAQATAPAESVTQQAPAESAPQQSASADTSSGTTVASSSAAPAPATNGNGLVQAAYAGIGSPYLWGGTSTAGFDCSGFINWVYNQAGRGGLPRTTYAMEASLQHVSSPQPGDIVLANGSSHGGIYVGNGQVISATPSGGVRLHGMNEGWHRVNAILRG